MDAKAKEYLKYIEDISIEEKDYRILKIEVLDTIHECFRLSMKYCGIIFEIKLIKNHQSLYWKLTPYNHSYFQTKATSQESFLLVLLAMRKHVSLV